MRSVWEVPQLLFIPAQLEDALFASVDSSCLTRIGRFPALESRSDILPLDIAERSISDDRSDPEQGDRDRDDRIQREAARTAAADDEDDQDGRGDGRRRRIFPHAEIQRNHVHEAGGDSVHEKGGRLPADRADRERRFHEFAGEVHGRHEEADEQAGQHDGAMRGPSSRHPPELSACGQLPRFARKRSSRPRWSGRDWNCKRAPAVPDFTGFPNFLIRIASAALCVEGTAVRR